MLYSELEANVKRSFSTSLGRTIEDMISGYGLQYFDTVTDEVVAEVVEWMKAKAFHQVWASVEFEIDDEEMKVLVIKRLTALRKRKPTAKQLEFYNDLVKALGREEYIEVPRDYFVFEMRLNEMKKASFNRKPATDKQKKYIAKYFGEHYGIEFPEGKLDVAQDVVKIYFDIINGVKDMEDYAELFE